MWNYILLNVIPAFVLFESTCITGFCAEILGSKYIETMKVFESENQKINSHVATSTIFFLSERKKQN